MANAVVAQLSGLVGERFFGFVVGQVLKLWAALVSAPGDGVARRVCGHSLFFARGERAGTAVFFPVAEFRQPQRQATMQHAAMGISAVAAASATEAA